MSSTSLRSGGGRAHHQRIRDAPWGLRTFVVADPDGNRLDIGQRL